MADGLTDEEWEHLQVISSRHNMDQSIRETESDNYWFQHAHDDRDYLLGVIDRLRFAQASEPRAIIRHFAAAMERKLAANDDKDTWRGESRFTLLAHLRDEVMELQDALNDMLHDEMADRPPRPDTVLSECADVALFAMFIADVCGALPPTDERGR